MRPSFLTVNAVTDLGDPSLENEAQAQLYLDCYGGNASRNPTCAMAFTLMRVSLLLLVVAWLLPPAACGFTGHGTGSPPSSARSP